MSLPRHSVAAPNAKGSSITTGKVDGHHLKESLQSAERKVKQPRQQENRHSRTGSKKILPHRSKPRNRKGLVQLLNKPKEESKGNGRTVQGKTKQLSHLVTPTTAPTTTNSSVTSSHFSIANTTVASGNSVATNNKPRVSSTTKSTPVNHNVPEVKSFQNHPPVSSSSIPQPLYYPGGSSFAQQPPYYLPAYQPHPPVPLGYPYPYHSYRYSSVPVYVADVTRRYNEMYGHHSNNISGVYTGHCGQPYRQCFGGVPQVCDASTQSSSQVPSSGENVPHVLLHHPDGVGANSESVLLAGGKENGTGKEIENLATNAKQLVIVRELVDALKKKLEGT